MPTSPAAANRPTLGFDLDLWYALTKQSGYHTEQERAKALGIHRATLHRICSGESTPGPEFIAAVRTAFPAADINRLFPIIIRKPVAS